MSFVHNKERLKSQRLALTPCLNIYSEGSTRISVWYIFHDCLNKIDDFITSEGIIWVVRCNKNAVKTQSSLKSA